MPPVTKYAPRTRVPSLLSLSVEVVSTNLLVYKDSLKYLPPFIKDKIIKKILRPSPITFNSHFAEFFAYLVHPNVKSVNLSSIVIDAPLLKALQRCTMLTDLNIRNFNEICYFTNQELGELFSEIPNLLILDVSHIRQFDDQVLESLARHCRNLRELTCEECNVTDGGFAYLALYNKKIKCLTISSTGITGEGISNAIRHRNWRQLREIRFDGCAGITDSVLRELIENCPKIEILTFHNCAITDETSIFQDISKTCKKLKQLHWTISW